MGRSLDAVEMRLHCAAMAARAQRVWLAGCLEGNRWFFQVIGQVGLVINETVYWHGLDLFLRIIARDLSLDVAAHGYLQSAF